MVGALASAVTTTKLPLARAVAVAGENPWKNLVDALMVNVVALAPVGVTVTDVADTALATPRACTGGGVKTTIEVATVGALASAVTTTKLPLASDDEGVEAPFSKNVVEELMVNVEAEPPLGVTVTEVADTALATPATCTGGAGMM